MQNKIYLSLGSNIGNRINNLSIAISVIKQFVNNINCSIILETEAILPYDSPDDWNKKFLNMVISGNTNLTPNQLLNNIKNIEKLMGRPEQYLKWAPRIIDIDILYYDNLQINTPNLVIPHPAILERKFLQHLLGLMGVKPWCKEKAQDFNYLSNSFVVEPKIVGVVNLTSDSFSDGGKFYAVDKAVTQINKLSEQGANVIEIGAQSTRPMASILPEEVEFKKLIVVLESISNFLKTKKIQISIDTFRPKIAIELIKKYNISIINDVGGFYDNESLRFIAQSGCKFCFMHSVVIPPDMNNYLSPKISIINFLLKWGKNYINRLVSLGFQTSNLIIDPGIGFGKSTYQNLEILKNIILLKKLKIPIMLGHSRKSYINSFSPNKIAANRDIETSAITLAVKNKIDFIRVHNVEDNMRSLVAYHLINN